MDFDKKEFYGIVAKAKKQMQITIDQDCNVADTKPDVEKMIQTRGIVKIQETEMMVDRVRIKGEFVFQGLYGTNDTSAYLESLEYSLPFEEYVHIEGVLPSDYVKVKYTIDDINTILINSRKISIRVLLTFSFQITEEMKEKGIIEIHEENVSVLKKDVQITDLIVNKKDIARLKEELVLPANKANIYQILWTQVDMENLQAKIGEHMIEIQGAMHIFVLYLGEDAQMPVQYARWEIPVDTQLECYECMPGMIGRIGMTLGGQQLEIRPDEDGEERIISLDVTIDCDIKIYEDHKIYFHGAKEGHKLDAIKKHNKASFCVIRQDQVSPEKFTTLYKSVIAFGKIRVVQDEEEKRASIALLGRKYSPGLDEAMEKEIEGSYSRFLMFALDIEHMTGKQCIELVH